MDNIEIISLLMNISLQILNKDPEVTANLSLLEQEELNDSMINSINSFEERLIIEASKDLQLKEFIDSLEFTSTKINFKYIAFSSYLEQYENFNPEEFMLTILERNDFFSKKRFITYASKLAILAISSGNKELIEAAVQKLQEAKLLND